jgi:hypothetical protein
LPGRPVQQASLEKASKHQKEVAVRYDAGWGHSDPYQRYDRDYRRKYGGFEWGRIGPEEYGDPHFDASRSRQSEYVESETGIWGPARYGLGPYHERLRRLRKPDEELKGDVEQALFFDTWVDADAITVEVVDGVVTLTGELPSYDEVRFATDDACDVTGVGRVERFEGRGIAQRRSGTRFGARESVGA